MRKFVTTLCAFAVALTLSVPVFAKHHEKKSKETATSATQNKSHAKHSKKKGATQGMKQGQEEATPKQ